MADKKDTKVTPRPRSTNYLILSPDLPTYLIQPASSRRAAATEVLQDSRASVVEVFTLQQREPLSTVFTSKKVTTLEVVEEDPGESAHLS